MGTFRENYQLESTNIQVIINLNPIHISTRFTRVPDSHGNPIHKRTRFTRVPDSQGYQIYKGTRFTRVPDSQGYQIYKRIRFKDYFSLFNLNTHALYWSSFSTL